MTFKSMKKYTPNYQYTNTTVPKYGVTMSFSAFSDFIFYFLLFVIKQSVRGQSADSELLLNDISIYFGFTV